MKFGNLVGQTLDGKYRIEKELGKGGMGAVYLSTHIGTERPVAVKVIVPQFMQRAEFVERFRREARAAGRLRHPNVVDVTDFGFADTAFGKVAYLVMEYLDGCTLGEILAEEGKLPVGWSIDILEQVCSAVEEAHRQGIIHRDLKPDNIWLEPNQRGGYTVKVLDFGIAKLEEQVSDPDNRPDESSGEKIVSESSNKTFAGITAAETFGGDRVSTAVSESATRVQSDENKTLLSEAGTLIHPDSGQQAATAGPEDKTVSIDEHAGTKLMSAPPGTNKPENTGAPTGQPLAEKGTKELTRVGAVLGTPLYMSPEQCRGERLDPRSDIYSLGVIAYQMLSGKLPFEGGFTQVMNAHQKQEPPFLDTKKVPKKLKQTVMLALSKERDSRPQTAVGLASKLRSSSEGIGTLLRRALVIYSERLPKFLLIAFLLAAPLILFTVIGVAVRFLIAAEVLRESIWTSVFSGAISFVTFFAQIFYGALLVGMTTWIVAHVLGAPLRPISVRATFRQAVKRWKSLLGTVTLSTLLAMISWGVGFVLGGVLSAVIAVPVYYLSGSAPAAIAIALLMGLLGAAVIGVTVTAVFMLIAPSIMMEGVKGRQAFRRSIELSRRSFRTVIATSILVYIVPIVLAMLIGATIGLVIKGVNPVVKPSESASAEQVGQTEEEIRVKADSASISITTDGEKTDSNDRNMAKDFRNALQQGLFELFWSPIVILLTSFTAVITSLLYFKTRQAGGETMKELLEAFEDAEAPRRHWQERVRQRLLESGKTTSRT